MSIVSPKLVRRAEILRQQVGKIGVIEAFTIVHSAPSGFDKYAPYPVAIAKFGRRRHIGQLTDYKGKSLRIGTKVRAVLRRSRREDEREVIEYVIKFKPYEKNS